MRKLCLTLGILLIGMLMMTGDAMAILYLPDLEFNNTGSATYTTGDKKLVVSGLPGSVTFDGVTKSLIDPFAPSDVKFYGEYVSGGYSPWYFTGDSANDPDITITGELWNNIPSGFPNSGTLITGNISSMVYNDVNERLSGMFDITGGDLYPYYASTSYQGMFDIWLEFAGGTAPTDPDHNWNSAGAKGDISPVPEPSSMLLLGMGLFGLGGAVRRKRFKA